MSTKPTARPGRCVGPDPSGCDNQVPPEQDAPALARKGRGAASNADGRYEPYTHHPEDGGWGVHEEPAPPLRTTVSADHARSIINRNDSPDIPFEQSINPYRGCEHGCVYCLSGDTPILMGDGGTRPLAEVRAGDIIYGTIREGGYRRYARTRVLDHWSVLKPAYRITLEDGTMLTASADHRFLTERGWKFVAGAGAGAHCRPHLTTGDKLMGTGRFAHPPVRNQDYRRALESEARLQVAGIVPLGKALQLYDITTQTGDFIANGVVSHNCYARPSHTYLGLSAGLDFESKLFAKLDAAALLERELRAARYRPKVIALGANTDPYQPIERRHLITRSILEVLHAARHPVIIITKSARVERDLDLLVSMAQRNLVQVFISVTTLRHDLARRLEPRATAPARRLQAIGALSRAGVPVGVLVAPVIPVLTDGEMESILKAAHDAGARCASYTLVRLPHEVKDLFREWLALHEPLAAEHVMSRIRETRGGKDNDPRFGSRMRGEGVYANMIRHRFRLAHDPLGFGSCDPVRLDTGSFRPPPAKGDQFTLF